MAQFITEELLFNTTALGGVTTLGLAVNDSEFRPFADGSPDPGFAGVVMSDSRVRIATYDVKNGLTYAGFAGYDLTGAGLKAFARPVANSGIRTNSGSYLITMATGLVLPRRLSASQGANAVLEMEAIGYNTSGTVPITIASSSTALSSPTQDVAFTLGPAVLNGSAVVDLTSMSIDFGIQELMNYADGLIYPKSVGIVGRAPVIRLGLRDAALAAAIVAGGYAVTQLDLYLRRLTLGGGGTTSGASSVHVKVAVDVAMARGLSMGGRPNETGIEVLPYYGGSTAQMVLTTDQALP